MPKEIFFNERDLERLKELSDDELYILCEVLFAKVHDTRDNLLFVMVSEETITQVVGLAETALKEIARRGGYNPIPSDGKYSTDGLTYDTPECRRWLSNHRKHSNRNNSCREFLGNFSFSETLLSQ